MSSISDPPRLAAFLRAPGVAVFLSGRFLAAMGVWAERIAIGWLIWEQTASPSLLGIAVFLRLAPAIALSPLGGLLADRRGAVRLLRACYSVNAAIALVFACFAVALPIWSVLALTCATGVVQALAAAPIKSVVPQIMGRDELSRAIPLSAATFNLAAFIGPALAGAAIATAGLWAAFGVSVAGCLVFVAVLRRWRGSDVESREPSSGWLRDLAAAAAYVREDPVIRPVFALHLAAALCLRPFIDLLPAYIDASGEGGAATLGLATSAFGAGAVLGAVWMAAAAEEAALARRILWGTLAALICLFALAWGGFAMLALPVILALGGAMVARATSTLTLIQLAVPSGLRGRVAGLYSMTIRGGSAAGAAAIGLAAEPLGLNAAMAAAAAICALCLVLGWRRIAGGRDTWEGNTK